MDAKPKKLPKQEELLVDYAERLKKHRKDRRGLHVRLSRLARHNRTTSHVRVAENAFGKLIKVYDGQIFRLSNCDLVFVGIKVPDSAFDDITLKLRFMFREDPFIELVENERDETAFCLIYDIDKNYAGFLRAVHGLVHDCERLTVMQLPSPDADAKKGDQRQIPLKPLTPADLARLENAIEGADLSNLIRKQAVCAIFPGAPPNPIFYERYISISGLRRSYLPNIDLRSDPWLFQRLNEHLNGRVLAVLPDYLDNWPVATSLNTTIATVLSDKFLHFDEEYRQLKKKKTLMFEFLAIDIFADISAYLFTHDYLRGNGYKICIDGLDPLTFCMIDRDQLRADIEKVVWSEGLIDKLEGGWRHRFAEAVQRAGTSRVVMCRCDDSAAIEFGQSMGIHLFQGKYIDQLLLDDSVPRAAANF